MNERTELLLKKIKTKFVDLLDYKFREGDKEHNDEGDLSDHPALLDEAINEVVDLSVYLLTLKEQLSRPDKQVDWTVFNEALQKELKAQEFSLDLAEWQSLVKAIKVAQKSVER